MRSRVNRTRTNRRNRNTIINHPFILLAICVCCSIIITLALCSNRAAAENSHNVETYYTSYEIQTGDTLWTIADQFMTPESGDRDDFINNVKRLNHIGSDNITAGNYLVIEYTAYSEL